MGSRAVQGSNAACSSQGLVACAPSPDLLCACPGPCPSCPQQTRAPQGWAESVCLPGVLCAPTTALLVPVTHAAIFALELAWLCPVPKDTPENSEAMVLDPKMP